MPLPSSSPNALTRARALSAALVAFALMSAPRAARAQEEAPPAPVASTSGSGAGFAPAAAAGGGFGMAGQWVLSMQSYNVGDGPSFFIAKSGGATSFFIQPALDYFLINGVSVGGAVGVGYGGGTTTVDIGARVGLNLNIVEHIGFWPTAGVDAAYSSGNHTSSSEGNLVISAPFLYHPVPHLFLGIGPFFGYQFDGNNTQYGLDFVIGGWL
jgi:hypothetical protein